MTALLEALREVRVLRIAGRPARFSPRARRLVDAVSIESWRSIGMLDDEDEHRWKPIGAASDDVQPARPMWSTGDRSFSLALPGFAAGGVYATPPVHHAPDGSHLCCDQALVCWPHPCPWHL